MHKPLPTCYTEFLTTDKSKWRNVEAPRRPVEWEKRLLDKAGKTIEGKPRLRLVWGGSAEWYFDAEIGDEIPSGWYKKYHLCFTEGRIKGWKYTDDNGKAHILPPDYRVAPPSKYLLTPLWERHSIGKPRWIVEFLDQDGEYRHLVTMEILEKGVDEEGKECQISRYVEPGEAQLEHCLRVFDYTRQSQKDKVAQVTAAITGQKDAQIKQREENIRRRQEEILKDLIDNKIRYEDLRHLPQAGRVTPKRIAEQFGGRE